MEEQMTMPEKTAETAVKKKNGLKLIGRTILFLLIFAVIAGVLLWPFRISDTRAYQTWVSFKDEPDNSVDVIVIGASNVYAFYMPTFAWHDHGLREYALAAPDMPAQAILYYLKEARKTQPDALYVITLNCYKGDLPNIDSIHWTADYMPFSLNKLQMIKALADRCPSEQSTALEYYLPIYRFHSGWNTFHDDPFGYNFESNGLKSSSYYGTFLKQSQIFSLSDIVDTDYEVPLQNGEDELLNELMDYCRDNNVNVVFQTQPQLIADESVIGMFNYAKRMVEERGFTCIDLYSSLSELGLSVRQDFYNSLHTNVHGAIKFTDYTARIYAELLGTTRREPDAANRASWDKAYDDYLDVIRPYTFEIEREHAARDYTMTAPVVKVKNNQGSPIVQWDYSGSKNDGFCVYRQLERENGTVLEDRSWELVAETTATARSYREPRLTSWSTYRYTVIPFRNGSDGRRIYGRFGYIGQEVKIIGLPPLPKSVEAGEDQVTIHWEPLSDALYYRIRRRISGDDNWIVLGITDGNTDHFIDTTAIKEHSYVYQIAAFYDRNGAKEGGYYSRPGLVLWRDEEKLAVTAELQPDGSLTLNWPENRYADGYRIDCRLTGGEWKTISKNVANGPYMITPEEMAGDASYRVVLFVENSGANKEIFSDTVIVNAGKIEIEEAQ